MAIRNTVVNGSKVFFVADDLGMPVSFGYTTEQQAIDVETLIADSNGLATIPNGVDVTGDTDSLGYKISDGNATENADDFSEAVEIIAEWYEDLDSWADGNYDSDKHEAIREAIDSVDQPDAGGLDELENYAGSVCTAIAEKLGGKDFYGHGNYAVSAASQAGINLTVTEIEE